MLSHVLAGRKDLSLATLTRALERIGYAVQLSQPWSGNKPVDRSEESLGSFLSQTGAGRD